MAQVERGEIVILSHLRSECRAHWTVNTGTWREKRIRVGQLADGRWFVDLVAQIGSGTRAYPTKQAAWQVVQQLMQTVTDGGIWTRIPCYPPPNPPTPGRRP